MLLAGPLPIVSTGYRSAWSRLISVPSFWAKNVAGRSWCAASASRMFGYAGPSNARAAEAYSKFILVDMYAKAVQGLPAADAVRWAAAELRKVYEG